MIKLFVFVMTIFLSACQDYSINTQDVSLSQSYTTVDRISFDRNNLKNYTVVPYHNERLSFSDGKNRVLIRIALVSSFRTDVDYVIVVDHRQLQMVTYYSQDDSGILTPPISIHKYQSGFIPVLSNHKFVFDAVKNSRYHYLEVDNYKDASMMMKVYEKNDYIRSDRHIQRLTIVLYTVMIILLIAAITYVLMTKNMTFIGYSGYVFFSLWAYFLAQGQLDGDSSSSQTDTIDGVWLSIKIASHLFLLSFFYQFLQFNRKKHKYGQLLIIWTFHVFMLLLMCLLLMAWPKISLFHQLYDWYFLTVNFGVLLSMGIAFKCYDNGNKQAGYLLLSLLFFLPFSIVQSFILLNPQPVNWWVQYSAEIGLCLQTFVLVLCFISQMINDREPYDHEKRKNIDDQKIKKISESEQHLIALANEKEANMRTKDRFFAHLSHELRTPLTLTIEPLKDLQKQREFLNTSGKYLVDTALSNAIDLMEQVNRMLDVQKLATERFPLNVKKENLNQLIYTAIKKLKPWSLDHNQNLYFEKTQQQDIFIYCDANEVTKIIVNMITNAIKYSGDNSEIKLSLSLEEYWIKLHINDDGNGIDYDIQDSVFDRYFQGDTEQHMTESGTGIGLSFVKEMMTLHHGKVSFTSQINEGCHFILWFKQGSAHFSHSEVLNEEVSNSIGNDILPIKYSEALIESGSLSSVLIVEDNRKLRNYLIHKLKGEFQVNVACDGEDGLKKALALTPDIIISDVMMPKMDGIAMLKAIRLHSELQTIPLILLTSKSTKKDVINGLKTGADHYLIKPFDSDDLIVRMHRLIYARAAIMHNIEDKYEHNYTDKKSYFHEHLDQIITKHIDEKDFNVEKLSSILHLDRSTLYRKIKKECGMTPVAYIRHIRMQCAMDLLKHKKLTVSETAYACGYDSLSYFSKQFKKTYGTSPSDVL